MSEQNIKRCDGCGGWQYATRQCVTCAILSDCMKRVLALLGLISLGLGFWSLHSIAKMEPFELGDDADCCNGDYADCCC